MNSKIKFSSRNPNYNLRTHLINLKQILVLDEAGNYQKYALPGFFHEYIHYYLQFHSFFHLEGYVYYLEELNYYFKQNIITPPFDSQDEEYIKIKESDKNWISRMDSKILGKNLDKKFINFSVTNFIPDEQTLNLPNNLNTYKNWSLKIENEHDEHEIISLKEDIINEGIAYIVEFLIDTYDKKTNEFVGSDLIYKVIPTIFADGKFNLFFFLILCDLSLQTFSPGEYFVYLLGKYFDDLQKDFQVDLTTEMISKYTSIYKEEMESKELIEYHETLISKFNKLLEEMKDKFPEIKWIDNLFDKGLNHVLDGKLPEYLIPLITNKSNEENISDVIKKFNPPIIKDNLSEKEEKFIFFDLFDDKVEGDKHIKFNFLFPALDYVRKFIKSNKVETCPNYSICKKKYKDDDCRNNPLLKVKEKDQCEIGIVFSKLNFNKNIYDTA